MSPPKKCYRAPDGACDFSSMTFVIVTHRKKKNNKKKKKIEGLNDISQSPQGNVIWPCGGVVTAGFEKWETLEDICKFIALLFKQVKRALGKIRFI